MGKKATIYDIAQKLNVSTATVSRSLNNHPSISDATKKLIIAEAKRQGYRLNKFAANLRNQKSNTIGVIVPRLDSYFMSTILAGIEKVANEVGYNVIISQSLESEEKEKINAKTLFDSGIDALLVSLASETSSYDHLTLFTDRNIPMLFFDRVYNLPNCPTVVIDNRKAGEEATTHLIAQGCKNILHVAGNLNRSVYAERFQGFKHALVNHDITFNASNVLETDLKRTNIAVLIDYVKAAEIPFDGIFIANDVYAVQCIRELQKEGYNIPKDIKIIGFNNDPVSEICTPNLTTIEYPGYEMGVLAGQSIINHLKGNIDLQAANAITLNHKLIIRESTIK